MMADHADLRAREDQRIATLIKGDAEALAAMVSDDLVHIHLNGKVDDKAGYLHGFRELYTFHAVARGDLTLRQFGTVAVMTGPLRQTIEVRATGQMLQITAITTQVWQQTPQGWILNTCHNAPVT